MNSVSVFNPPLPTKEGDNLIWTNVQGCALALSLVRAAQTSHSPIVIIAPDPHRALQLEREIKLFAPHELEVKSFPDWETLPYDSFSPHQDIISERLATLSVLPRMSKGLVIVPISTMIHRIIPKGFLTAHSFTLKVGDSLSLENTRQQLTDACYRHVGEVSEHGEFAIRGSILDLFPMGSELPIRIDLFDDEVDTIRYFDPQTQRSHEKVDSIRLLPGREFPLTDEAVKTFRQKWREHFSGNPKECSTYHDVSHHVVPPGIEYYLPLFFDEMSVFTDYIPANAMLAFVEDAHTQAQHFWESIQERYDQYGHDRLKPILPPKTLFIPIEQLFQQFKPFKQIHAYQLGPSNKTNAYRFNLEPIPDISLNHKLDNPLKALQTFIEQCPARVLICSESKGRRESLKDLLKRSSMRPTLVESHHDFLNGTDGLALTIAPIDKGFYALDESIVFIAEAQLYGTQVMQRRRRRKAQVVETDYQIRNLAELRINDPIVHLDFGVGRYKGLVHMNVGPYESEFLQIEYAGNDKLYVPVSSLELISKFTGMDPEHAPVNKLGSDQWEKAKKKALQKAHDAAAELLAIYAQREARLGHAFEAPDDQYRAFSSQFPFEETPDQAKAIEDVIQDMQNHRPMDRLVCGDVGFGKTEVAMRAAFLALQNGYQVAILVPTTLLAQQHFETFSDRFAEWPVKVRVLSRFKTKKEQDVIIDEISKGQVDIVIGTHKLIQSDIKFKRLGLVVIDEEHRFGVKQKERLKSLRSEVDILTLTATPIPRTLNMAFSHLRDLSIIATPPQKRLSIKTFVRERQNGLIREAILRELMRGGQVYFLHNSVETIDRTAHELKELLPEARLGVAHGQMRERELEGVMADFYHQRFNVLVCTTIIETGIDVPSANTIVIDRADKLGLAQLHQLRGRVGRSHHQAYAYCLTPPQKNLNPDAVKRLEALSSLEDLGSGFTLASHDLEIRGAGEILGEEQSGDMQTIGFTLYMEILERAVNALKRGDKPLLDQPLHHGPEIDLSISALIPENYVHDVSTRLVLYKRISHAKSLDALRELQVEMIDRFGLLPEPVKNLFKVTELKQIADPMGIKKIEAGNQGGRLLFQAQPNIDPGKIIELIRTKPHQYQIKGSEVLKFKIEMPETEDRFKIVEQLLQTLQPSTLAV